MTDSVDVMASCWDVMIAEEVENLRTCTPVHITIPNVSLPAVTCEGQTAVPDQLPDGSAGLPALLSERPVWYPGGGGFYMRWPMAAGDIALGLVSDRSLAAWSLTRLPGPAAAPTFPHFHNISDTQILPVTDTPCVPEADPGLATDYVIGGPAGVAIRLAPDGTITLTTAAATVTVAVDGTITLDGPTVNVGGAGALVLAKAQALTDALDAAITAAVSAAAPITPPNGDGGTAGFTAMQTTWNANKATIATTKAKGV